MRGRQPASLTSQGLGWPPPQTGRSTLLSQQGVFPAFQGLLGFVAQFQVGLRDCRSGKGLRVPSPPPSHPCQTPDSPVLRRGKCSGGSAGRLETGGRKRPSGQRVAPSVSKGSSVLWKAVGLPQTPWPLAPHSRPDKSPAATTGPRVGQHEGLRGTCLALSRDRDGAAVWAEEQHAVTCRLCQGHWGGWSSLAPPAAASSGLPRPVSA